ncbi:MAG: Rho termination factor N-terminal domain-containing protein [Rhodospirillales bacterium]|nr:Rho termination factor N-terminal domain-containing protein [Rhodospirillales bacterium]
MAIGLREAGASKYESDEKNEENLGRTKERERRGETAEDTAEEGGGGDSRQSGTAAAPERTKEELYRQAKEKDIPGRSEMNKQELAAAVKKAGK